MTDPIQDAKNQLREKLRQLRLEVTPVMAEAASQSLWNGLSRLPEFKKAVSIGAFASNPQEINTFPILESGLEIGKKIFLPRLGKDKTTFHYFPVLKLEDLQTGPFGIPEPRETRPADWEELDLVLVPGLAFDPLGTRLGYGKGFFDKILPLLNRRCLTIGLAYSFQVLDLVPATKGDVPVKALLTEKGFIYCKTS